MNGSDLLVDVLKDNELWESFADIAKETYDSKLGSALYELERIRHIDHSTDTVFVERALRQAGLNLSNEFFSLNRDKLTKSHYELIKFWEVNGTPRYTKFIEFLLGRTFIEDTLYTTDEETFSPAPGKLLVDGGYWYSTSHVDLSVEADQLRESLNLRITQEDIPSIRTALGYSTADQDEKDAINTQIKALQIRELDLETDDARIIKVLTENRILSTYYQFAPIEKVVRNIYLTIQVRADLRVFGSSIVPARRYIDTSTNVVVGYDFRIPQKIQGYREYTANVLINWSETTRQDPEQFPMSLEQDSLQSEIYPASVVSKDGDYVQSFDGKTIVFNDVDEITTITLTIVAQGIKWETTRELYPIGIPFAPDALFISGPTTPLEGATNTYTMIAKTDNIRESAEQERVTWSIQSDVASFTDNVLSIQEIFEDYPATVVGTYRNLDSTYTSVEYPVVLKQETKERTAKTISISVYKLNDDGSFELIDALSDIEQSNRKIYAVGTVEYNDDTSMELYSKVVEDAGTLDAPLGIWSTSTSQVTVEEDVQIVSPVLFRDYSATISVTYVDNGRTLTANKDIFFKKPRVFVESIDIQGPSVVIEETRTVFQLYATWNTGAITTVVPNWGSSNAGGAKSATVSSTGILFAPTVDADVETVNVTASISAYRYDDQDQESIVTLKTDKQVTVKPLQRAVQRIEVQTLNSIRQGNTNLIRFYAQWNDSTVTEIVPHRIEVLREEEVISSFVKADSETFDHAEKNPVILGLHDTDTFYAKELDQTHARFELDYLLAQDDLILESFNGLIDLNVYYIDPLTYTDQVLDSTGLEAALADTDLIITQANVKISAIPKIFLSESISIVYPENMKESTRTFLTALVQYENGDIEEAVATWTIEPLYVDQDIEADMAQGQFSFERIINGLLAIDRRWFDANTLSNAQIETLKEGDYIFQQLAEQNPANWTLSVRNMMDQHTVAAQVSEALGLETEWFASNILTTTQIDTLRAEVDRYIALTLDGTVLTQQEFTDRVYADLTSYPLEILYNRALLQTRPLEDGTTQSFNVTGRFFQQEETVTINNIANSVQVVTEVFSGRIDGPGEITADTSIFFSYGLVTDFDDVGVTYMSSNAWRLEIENKRSVLSLLESTDTTYRSLLPTRSDLSVIEVDELTEDQLDEIFIQIKVAEIDTNGYVYPRINVPANLIVYADYDDGITSFTKSMQVYMKETATILTAMGIYNINNTGDFQRTTNVTASDTSGANDVILLTDVPVLPDLPEGFQRIDSTTGALIYTFKAVITRTDDLADENGFYAPQVVEWSLDTASDVITLGTIARDTVTVIVNPVEEDTQVILNGTYQEDFTRSETSEEGNTLVDEDRSETRSASLRFIIESSTAIETITVLGSTVVFDNVGNFYPSASITRRDGTLVADASALLEWFVVAGPSALVQNDDNSFAIPTLSNNTTMTLRAVATEGARTISEDFVFNLQLAFQPQSIDLILPQVNQSGLLDSSVVDLRSSITDLDNNPNDVTSRTLFYFNYNEDIAELEDNILTIESVGEDTEITITLRSQDYQTLNAVNKTLTVYSTFPVYGTAPFGVTTSELFDQQLIDWDKLFNRSGGTFEVDPGAEEYGYFAHPKSLGIASFIFIPELNSSEINNGGWDGAQRDSEGQGTQTGPITVTRTYSQDLTEEWYLYRTNLRGFSRGKFAVSYSPE